jgi:hypothetical protein
MIFYKIEILNNFFESNNIFWNSSLDYIGDNFLDFGEGFSTKFW